VFVLLCLLRCPDDVIARGFPLIIAAVAGFGLLAVDSLPCWIALRGPRSFADRGGVAIMGSVSRDHPGVFIPKWVAIFSRSGSGGCAGSAFAFDLNLT